MVPTLGISREGLETNGFIDAYSQDSRREIQYENAVYLLFKPKNMDKFRDFVEFERERKSRLIDEYDYEDGFVILVYNLNEAYKADFELIRKGKYSKTSEEFQSLFPRTKKIYKRGKYNDELSLQYRIFTKDKSLIDYWEEKIGIRFKNNMELWEGYDEELEILNMDKIKEIV